MADNYFRNKRYFSRCEQEPTFYGYYRMKSEVPNDAWTRNWLSQTFLIDTKSQPRPLFSGQERSSMADGYDKGVRRQAVNNDHEALGIVL
eukprot:scaffold57374_cov45-Prasinocladus_malaysianus.AAC.1